MYFQRFVYLPSAGKARSLRELLAIYVKQRQQEGFRTNLLTAVFSPDADALSMRVQSHDLDGVEAYRAALHEASLDDPAANDAINELLREPVRAELHAVLLALPQPDAPVRYVLRTTNIPSAGNGALLEALVCNHAQRIHAGGGRMTVSVQLAGPAAGSVVTVSPAERLSDLPRLRPSSEPSNDDDLAAYDQAIGALCEGHPTVEVSEIIIPYSKRLER
jgi:hypothetical protein